MLSLEKRRNVLFIGVAYAVLFVWLSITQAHAEISSRKIVVFKPGVSETVKAEVVRNHGTSLKHLSLINAEVVMTGGRSPEELKKNPHVLRVDDDIVVQAFAKDDVKAEAKGKTTPPPPPEQLPWGIDRIDAEKTWDAISGPRIKIGIIDTGIDLTHPDLKANIKGGVNTISPFKSYADDNGHGTHVAGIIGALHNTVGVAGVDPMADLYSIKVLNRSGSGYFSDIIEGLQYAIANDLDVVNMSLGASTGNDSFAEAIKAAHDAGIVIVAAAGNEAGAVSYPAAYPEVIAVSATDENNAFASFSNYGPEIDISAPGVRIYSAYKGGVYKILSGTSMASPHVAGVAALVLSKPIQLTEEIGTPDGAWQPEEVLKKMQDTATDLGNSGFDNWFGAGLVNAYLAVQ
ncbi:MAG: S8 family peptidase [Candidatus Paceibacterota bacterium]|jgi:subtilisin family serine protease